MKLALSKGASADGGAAGEGAVVGVVLQTALPPLDGDPPGCRRVTVCRGLQVSSDAAGTAARVHGSQWLSRSPGTER